MSFGGLFMRNRVFIYDKKGIKYEEKGTYI